MRVGHVLIVCLEGKGASFISVPHVFVLVVSRYHSIRSKYFARLPRHWHALDATGDVERLW